MQFCHIGHFSPPLWATFDIPSTSLPTPALQLDYSKEEVMQGYLTLFANASEEEFGNNIERDDYSRGYSIYAFDLDPSVITEAIHPVKKGGNVKIEIGFDKALPETAQLIIYAQFVDVIEIDSDRNVHLWTWHTEEWTQAR